METENSNKPKRQYGPIVVRILMGLAFTTFGLNGFLHFMPEPKEMPENIMSFLGALKNSGYLSIAMGTQLLVGILLLANRFVPLALALIAPILVGIISFHIRLQPSGLGPGIVLSIMALYLAWAYRGAFAPMLAMNASPGPGKPTA